eukprot:Gb_39702 [translate_table: standard]
MVPITRTFGKPVRNRKKKIELFLEPMSHLRGRKGTIKTVTAPFKTEGNANDNSIVTLCKQSRLNEALQVLHVVDQPVDSYTYASLLQVCTEKKTLSEGKIVHLHMNERGFVSDRFLGNTLVNMYAKCGSLVDARRVFDEMAERDVCSWTVMIAAYSRHGFAEEALVMFYQMQRTGIQPNQFTFTGVLPACAKLAALQQGMEIHEDIIRRGFQSDVFVESALVDMYAKCGSMESACDLFDKMPQRNVVSWNTMIAGYTHNGYAEEALKLFCTMPERNVVSWNTMIAGFARKGYVDEALKFFQKMPEPNVVSWNAMIAAYTQNGHVDEAFDLFQKMPEPDVISWNAMVSGFAQNGHGEMALKLFQQMQLEGMKPDRNTFASVLPACANLAALECGMEIHEDIIRTGLQFDVFVESVLVDMYAKCGSMEKASVVFDKMRKRDTVSWTTMIAGYAQNGRGVEALKLFHQMQLAGLKPDSKTFSSVLPACSNLAALEHGMEIHEDIIRNGFQSDVFVENALVDLYAKCGTIDKARNVFDKIHQRDVICWNTMIAGYAMHGSGSEALKLFEQMQDNGPKPNHVTLLCVLSACCHAGLVDEGRQYFDLMSQYYRIKPEMKHYVCVVDLLGRAGRIDEAQDFINKMPIKPDATVWSCLLGACRTHSNIELGQRVAEYLLELDPKNATPYVLLSNIYAAAGRWDDTENVRRKMKDRGIEKMPGCSWIQVNKQVHAFLIGDRSHPQTLKNYSKFEDCLSR